MKKTMFFPFTLLLTAIMALTPAAAEEYVPTTTMEWQGVVESVAFRDSGTLLSGSNHGTLIAWDVNTGGEKWYQRQDESIWAVAISSRKPFIVAHGGEKNYRIRTRYASQGAWRGEIAGHTDAVLSLAFKPGEYLLASGSDDKTVRIWNLADANNLRHVRTLKGHASRVWAVAWSPNGQTLASAGDDGTVRLWNPNNGKSLAVLRGHQGPINSVAWSPDGQTLASGSSDETIRIWSLKTKRTLRALKGHANSVASVAFAPNGNILASGDCCGQIRLWNPKSGKYIALLTGHSNRVRAMAFSPYGKTFASGSDDGTIRLWKLLPVDVNNDGKVTFRDIIAVANNYGKTVAGGANRRADINNDGTIDIEDLILVAKAIDTAAAPALAKQSRTGTRSYGFTEADVERWIRDARQVNAEPEGIAALKRLLAALTFVEAPPTETALFANYPNPFNPETWIPYQLATRAGVTVTIHAADGKLVRTLALGQLPAGVYQSRSRAAYWDGRNVQGEPVASGAYFYTLTVGDFTATKKMLVRK